MNGTVCKLTSLGAVVALITVLFAGCCIASDESDAENQNSFSWTVGTAVSSVGIYGRPMATEDVYTVTGSVPGITFSYGQQGNLGVIYANGTPTTAGTYVVQIYDSGTLADTATITVASATTTYTYSCMVGTALSTAIIAQFPGTATDYSPSASIPGLTITAEQNQQNVMIVANGTPTTAGSYVVTVSSTIKINVTVSAPTSSETKYVTLDSKVGESLNYTCISIEYVSGTIPGCTVESITSSGTLFLRVYGTPTTAGTYTIKGTIEGPVTLDNVTYLDGTGFVLTVNVASNSYTHTVVYNANGGSGTMSNTVVTDTTNGNTAVTLASNTFTRSGYTFAGWYTAASGGSQVTSVSVGANASTTVYAHWTQNTTSTSLSSSQLYVVEGETVSFKVTGSCNNGATYSATASTTGGSLSKTSGIANGNTITFTAPQVSGSATYTVTVTSNVSGYTSSSAYVNITVVDKLVLGSPTAGTPTSS